LATSDCLRYHQTSDKLTVKQIAEQILGWLVLSSIDEHEIQNIFPCCTQHESLFFTLAVDSFAGVEIVLSRRFNHKTTWQKKDSPDPKGTYAIPSQQSCFKWEDEETVRKMLIEIWNAVFPALDTQKSPDSKKLDETELRKLDSTLRSRRIKSRNAEHYYIAFKLPKDDSFAENVYRQLLNCLPQMTVVQFGVKGSGNLFLIPEEYVSTEVNEFYRAINS
jgi:hypothetical protein